MTQQTKLEGWTFQENGDLDCKPMVGYGIVPFGGGMGAVLRVEYVTDETKHPLEQEASSIQVSMTLPGILNLIQSLGRVAQGMSAQLGIDLSKSNPS
jgi:hypothetical protein